MGRKRQYASAAERLKAFRTRAQKAQVQPTSAPSSPPNAARKASRPARLVAVDNEVRALVEEYQAWRERLPESLQESSLAGKLDEAIDKLTEIADALADVDLPRGFGRD